MSVTRVTVFGAESSESYDSAVQLGLRRAHEMVDEKALTVEKYTVTDRRHEVAEDDQNHYRVGLNVHFQVGDSRE